MSKSFLYEIPVFYFFLVVLERAFFPDNPGFIRSNPHPYWLGILLFAFRYGLYSGIFCGLLSGSLYLGLIWFLGDRYLFEDAEFYLLPGLFAITGMAIGGGVDKYRHTLSEKNKQLEDNVQKIKSLAKEISVQKQSNRTMEKQMVSQMGSLVTLYQGARHLGNLERDALIQGILDFFTQALQAKKAAVYMKEAGAWVLKNKKGWNKEETFPTRVDFREGIIGKAGSENRVVSLRDFFGTDTDKAWAGRDRADALLAGPLRKSQDEVVGVFCVQDIPFLKYNSATLNLLQLLLDWAEASIAKSAYFEELKSKSILDEIFNVYNTNYFQSRMEQEFTRSKTYSLPLSLLLISIKNLATVPVDRQVKLLRAVSQLLLNQSRAIDIVTKFPEENVPFAVLMLTSSKSQAEEMRKKIQTTFEKLDLISSPLALSIGVGSFTPEMNATEALIEEATKSLT